MNPVSAYHYSYHVRWSPEDRAFVATVTEFPSLSAVVEKDQNAFIVNDPLDALDEIMCRVIDTIEDLVARGEPVPPPAWSAS